MENIITEFKQLSKEPDYGKISNDILYDMCVRFPKHKDDSEIIAKIMLIGRAYAASIERHKKRKEKVSDDFYKEKVAPKFKARVDMILSDVENLKSKDFIMEEDVPIILQTHKQVMDFIHEEITGDDKRSFVSKYLHFHFRNLFFIFDSRVAEVISDVASKCGYRKKDYENILNNADYDRTYANFFVKSLVLSNFIKKTYMPMTPREIDNYLIKKANLKRK